MGVALIDTKQWKLSSLNADDQETELLLPVGGARGGVMDQIIPDYITWRMKKNSLVCRIHFTTRKRLFLLINFASMPGDNSNDIQACTRTCLSRRRGFR